MTTLASAAIDRHARAGVAAVAVEFAVALALEFALAVTLTVAVAPAVGCAPPGEASRVRAPSSDAGGERAGAPVDRSIVREPFVVVLGVAQDGGLPQIGCERGCCSAARRDPSRVRRVASLGLISDGNVFVVDATPDFPAQAAALAACRSRSAAHGPPESGAKESDLARRGPVDGIFLTHAHVGHYLGLAHLGREVFGARDVPVYCTDAMARYLSANAPWAQLAELRQVEIRRFPSEGVSLQGGLRVVPVAVPHRGEYTDALAFRIEGPARSVLYLPDIDAWNPWTRRLEDAIAEVDRAYLDGTFYSDGELPNRDLAEIPHPRVRETIERLRDRPSTERAKVRFTHMNHTNPLHDPASRERALVEEAGFGVAEEGEMFSLAAP